MTLLDPPAEPQGKSRAGKITLIAVVLAAIIGAWFSVPLLSGEARCKSFL